MRSRERHPFAPTRRHLGSLIAAGAALALPAVAASAATFDPDAELIALGRKFEDAWKIETATVAHYKSDMSQEAERACEAAFDRMGELAEQIELLPATTLAGLRVKVLALEWIHQGDDLSAKSIGDDSASATDFRLIASILRDIRAIA